MSSFIVPTPNGGFVDYGLQLLESKLQRHDRRLFLTVGRVVDRKTGRCVKEMIEVRWRADNGKEHFVGAWNPEEINKVEAEVLALDQTSRHFENPVDRAERHNAQKEQEAQDLYADTMLRLSEHAAFAAGALPKQHFVPEKPATPETD